MDELTLSIVGIDYPNEDKSKSNRRMELLLCVPGEPVELRLEPKNPFDENAIAVFSVRGVQVGYLTAERAPWIAKRIQGEEFTIVFQQLFGGSAAARIRFGGGEPSLPPPTPEPAPPAQPRPLRAARPPSMIPMPSIRTRKVPSGARDAWQSLVPVSSSVPVL